MCAKRFPRVARPRRSGRWPIWWTGSPPAGQHRADPSWSPARRRTQRRAGRTGAALRCRHRRHHRGALRGSVTWAAGDGDGGHPGPAVAGLRGRVAGSAGWGAPAVRGGDGPVVRVVPRGGDRGRRARRAVRLWPTAHRAAAAAVRCSRRAHRGQLAAVVGHGGAASVRAAQERAPGVLPDRA